MKRVALIKHLRRNGCRELREGAKHSVWLNPILNLQTSVPRHNEIKETVAAAICKHLGIPRP